MKALVNFQPLSFYTSGEYFLIWKQTSRSPEGLRPPQAPEPAPPHARPPPSPLVSVQSTAMSTAFSRGSPTSVPSSSCMSEWQEAKARCVSTGSPLTGVTSFPSLRGTTSHSAQGSRGEGPRERSARQRGRAQDAAAGWPSPFSVLWASAQDTHRSPATPRTTRLSLVRVPVLSKQHTSTLPAKGMRKGSVQ